MLDRCGNYFVGAGAGAGLTGATGFAGIVGFTGFVATVIALRAASRVAVAASTADLRAATAAVLSAAVFAAAIAVAYVDFAASKFRPWCFVHAFSCIQYVHVG